ncbi:hypothetical protein TREMEDRAFT_66150 [Tremella mesenterica DSM 1558]|uniref:uncharacterized protein n=1 Tax=Tremella mesenterica (strain ATCC 24925 / CBS 8224 / DSM 1558 / NBRC 9311 / NRRL Y-6157 / RJB 2259-6 / UBC 559-6) TaxID=578456 RepID=UPI00032B9B55|nr:uncharacterized protein TREMEDRAFT_66150 [Tremella mesenterica DSM 1558]EIW65777.1 hypothetical protein TREMEDRAFT_66150 [Tremella mesenterica DSM 1558]
MPKRPKLSTSRTAKSKETARITSAPSVLHTRELCENIIQHVCQHDQRSLLLTDKSCFHIVVPFLWETVYVRCHWRNPSITDIESWTDLSYSPRGQLYHKYINTLFFLASESDINCPLSAMGFEKGHAREPDWQLAKATIERARKSCPNLQLIYYDVSERTKMVMKLSLGIVTEVTWREAPMRYRDPYKPHFWPDAINYYPKTISTLGPWMLKTHYYERAVAETMSTTSSLNDDPDSKLTLIIPALPGYLGRLDMERHSSRTPVEAIKVTLGSQDSLTALLEMVGSHLRLLRLKISYSSDLSSAGASCLAATLKSSCPELEELLLCGLLEKDCHIALIRKASPHQSDGPRRIGLGISQPSPSIQALRFIFDLVLHFERPSHNDYFLLRSSCSPRGLPNVLPSAQWRAWAMADFTTLGLTDPYHIDMMACDDNNQAIPIPDTRGGPEAIDEGSQESRG